MIFVVDFDGTLVSDDRLFEDVTTPLEMMPNAREALLSLRAAGHVLVLQSRRANRSLREDWRLDPLWRDGVVPIDPRRWEALRPLHVARYEQMLRFVAEELPGVFHHVDEGEQGKVNGDVFVDDRAVHFGKVGWWGSRARDWAGIAVIWGEDAVAEEE